MSHTKDELIKYRLDRANEVFEDGKILAKEGNQEPVTGQRHSNIRSVSHAKATL